MRMTTLKGSVRIAGWLFLLCLVQEAAHANRLRSPWDGPKIDLTDAPHACPAPPPFAKTLAAESYYIDAHHSVIDPAKKAAFDQATEAPTHLGQWAGLAADAYLKKGSRAGAECVYSLLEAAAHGDAWTGDMPTGAGHYEQHWLLSGAAMAYLKVRDSGVGTPAQDKAIQGWLGKLSGRVRDYVQSKRGYPGSDAWNNHAYWSALAVGAAGIADNNAGAFHWALAEYKDGVGQIDGNGVLPLEMARAGRALHYHLYALAPLVMVAELASANGIDLYAENHDALTRLAKLCEAGLAHPEIFEKATGVKQEMADSISGFEIGWAVPYTRHFPDPQLSAWVGEANTTRFWQWGGLPPN